MQRLLTRESGSTAVEYGLITAVFVLCLFGAAATLKGLQAAAFQSQHESLKQWRAP
ncbi:MAG: Flp family type IVb pilin [Candidatus Sericytochromatia bacterium]|nr:Flp family type IVb pilin [Candidatus Sericytochromatia bacterium]